MNWVGERAESSLLVLKVVILFRKTKNFWKPKTFEDVELEV